MSTIPRKEKHEMFADVIIGKVNSNQVEVGRAIHALDFMMSWSDDVDKQMIAYVRDCLQNINLHTVAIIANVQKLAELANPNLPEDLPF